MFSPLGMCAVSGKEVFAKCAKVVPKELPHFITCNQAIRAPQLLSIQSHPNFAEHLFGFNPAHMSAPRTKSELATV
jgi:hypothetical protein